MDEEQAVVFNDESLEEQFAELRVNDNRSGLTRLLSSTLVLEVETSPDAELPGGVPSLVTGGARMGAAELAAIASGSAHRDADLRRGDVGNMGGGERVMTTGCSTHGDRDHLAEQTPDGAVVADGPLISDGSTLAELAVAAVPLTPEQAADRARRAAGALDLSGLSREGSGEAVLLWRSASSEAWLNLWWEPRDTGYHDHDGSCVGVHVIEGLARNEALVIGRPRQVPEYSPGETFSFGNDGIHRMEHEPGAVTIHVYSPPIRSLGHYELVNGTLRRMPGGPDDPSPESPNLLATLSQGSCCAAKEPR